MNRHSRVLGIGSVAALAVMALALTAGGPPPTAAGSGAEGGTTASVPTAVEPPDVKGLPVGAAIAKLTDAGFAVAIAESSNEPATDVVVGGQSPVGPGADGLQTVSLVVRPFTESSEVTTDAMEVSRGELEVVVLLASRDQQLLEASLPAVQRYSGPLGQVSIQTQGSFEPTLPADYVVVALFENKVMAGRFAQQMRELGFPATVLKARRVSPAPVYINKDEPDI